MKILLGDFNEKSGREDIIKLKIGIESLHEDSTDNGVRIVNFVTSKILVVKSTMFPHRNIHKYTWTSPDGKTHNTIDHILIDRRCFITNALKQGYILSSLSFTYSVGYAIRGIQANQNGLKLNGTHKLLVYADVINILGRSVHTIRKRQKLQ